MDLVSRAPLTSLTPDSKPLLPDGNPTGSPPFKVDCKSDHNPTWEEVIVALLNHDHIWEANTLLAIHLRHARPMESELLRILDAVPDGNDTMYDLVRLTMLVLCSRFLLRQSWQVLAKSEVFDRCEACAQKLHLSAMDAITDPISSSRAYQDFRLLSLEVENNRAWDAARIGKLGLVGVARVPWTLNDVQQHAQDQGDYMLLVVSHQQSVTAFPFHRLRDTGAWKGAIAVLHPRNTDWKLELGLTNEDPGSGPSSLKDGHYGVERLSAQDSSSTQRSAMKPVIYDWFLEKPGLSNLSIKEREQLDVREGPGGNYSAYEAKTTQLSSADCLDILQKALTKIELCQRYLHIAQRYPNPSGSHQRTTAPSEEAYTSAIKLRREWQDDPDVNKIFETSFLQEAEDELRMLNSFDKWKSRKRGPSDEDDTLTETAMHRCSEVVRLAAACKALNEAVEAVFKDSVRFRCGHNYCLDPENPSKRSIQLLNLR